MLEPCAVKSFKKKFQKKPLKKRADKKFFMDTVIFSTVVSKKLICDEEYE